jgi:hypothetical protein
VRGAVHVRDGVANQDAVAWSEPDGPDGPVVVALSDGHGGSRSPRSEVGARFAVDVAVEVAVDVGRSAAGAGAGDEVTIAQAIVDRWVATVDGHLAVLPLTGAESEATGDDPLLAYGATLLLAVVVGDAAVLMQLGDGDILLTGPNQPAVRPVPADPRLFGNATTSLCMPGAAREFRCATVPLPAREPSVLILATDGLANAYGDERAFLQVGTDLAGLIDGAGLDGVRPDLDALLAEASAHSGDDVTVAVVLCDGRAVTSRR